MAGRREKQRDRQKIGSQKIGRREKQRDRQKIGHRGKSAAKSTA